MVWMKTTINTEMYLHSVFIYGNRMWWYRTSLKYIYINLSIYIYGMHAYIVYLMYVSNEIHIMTCCRFVWKVICYAPDGIVLARWCFSKKKHHTSVNWIFYEIPFLCIKSKTLVCKVRMAGMDSKTAHTCHQNFIQKKTYINQIMYARVLNAIW